MRIEPAQVTLRPALPTDHAFRFAVFASTRSEELAQCGWPPEQQTAFLKTQFAAQEQGYTAAFPDATSSLVCLVHTPVGILVVNRSSAEIRIVNIAFLPAYRGRGLGRQVVETLQQEARIHHQPLRLHVFSGNRAQRLYERLGFETVGENGLFLKMEWKAAAPLLRNNPVA